MSSYSLKFKMTTPDNTKVTRVIIPDGKFDGEDFLQTAQAHVNNIANFYQPIVTDKFRTDVNNVIITKTTEYEVVISSKPGKDTWGTVDRLIMKFYEDGTTSKTLSISTPTTPPIDSDVTSFVTSINDVSDERWTASSAYMTSYSDTTLFEYE